MHSQAHQESPTDTQDHYSATGHLDGASQAAENFHVQSFEAAVHQKHLWLASARRKGIFFPPYSSSVHPLSTPANKAIGIQKGARMEKAERDKKRKREERFRIHGGYRASKRQLMCRGYNGG